MLNYNNLLQIVVFIPIVLFFIVNHKGLLYDAIQEKYDMNYKGSHSISWRNGRMWFSLPGYIFDKIDNIEIKRIKISYNKMSVAFWITTAITIILYNIKKT